MLYYGMIRLKGETVPQNRAQVSTSPSLQNCMSDTQKATTQMAYSNPPKRFSGQFSIVKSRNLSLSNGLIRRTDTFEPIYFTNNTSFIYAFWVVAT